MWEINSRFPTQLNYAEIYAYIESTEFELNEQNLTMDDYVPAPARSGEHLHGADDPFLVSSLDATAVNAFSTPPTEI